MIPYEKITDEMVMSFAKNASFTRLVVASNNVAEELEKINYSLILDRDDMVMFHNTKYYRQTEELHTRLIEKKMRVYSCYNILQKEISSRMAAR